jgi:hypothetical protein
MRNTIHITRPRCDQTSQSLSGSGLLRRINATGVLRVIEPGIGGIWLPRFTAPKVLGSMVRIDTEPGQNLDYPTP